MPLYKNIKGEKMLKVKTIRASFHNHTTFSDGADSPVDLLRKAFTSGITHFTVTDHDTHRMLSPEHIAELMREGFTLDSVLLEDGVDDYETRGVTDPFDLEQDTGVYRISDGTHSLQLYRGVEYTVKYGGTQRHLVGLGIHYPSSDELRCCLELKTARTMRIQALADEINASENPRYANVKINHTKLAQLIADSVPSRLHLGAIIADLLNGKSREELHELLEMQGGGDTVTARTAMRMYVTKELKNYQLSQGIIPKLKKKVDLIHRLGGVAILPHIGRNGLGDRDQYTVALYNMISDLGLDGFEVQEGEYNDCNVSEEYSRIAAALHKARSPLGEERFGVLISWGSDYHGDYNKHVEKIVGIAPPQDHPDAIRKLEERMRYWRIMKR